MPLPLLLLSHSPPHLQMRCFACRRRCMVAHCVTPCVGGPQTLRCSCDRPAASKRRALRGCACCCQTPGRTRHNCHAICLPCPPPTCRQAHTCRVPLPPSRCPRDPHGHRAAEANVHNAAHSTQVETIVSGWGQAQMPRVCQTCIQIPTHMPNTTA